MIFVHIEWGLASNLFVNKQSPDQQQEKYTELSHFHQYIFAMSLYNFKTEPLNLFSLSKTAYFTPNSMDFLRECLLMVHDFVFSAGSVLQILTSTICCLLLLKMDMLDLNFVSLHKKQKFVFGQHGRQRFLEKNIVGSVNLLPVH